MQYGTLKYDTVGQPLFYPSRLRRFANAIKICREIRNGGILVTVADKQENKDGEQSLLLVNGMAFIEVSRGDDYVLYQARERRKLGDIVVNIFLEQVPDKGWWGALRLNGYFRVQINLNRATLFPTPEIVLLVTEEFLAEEQHVREVLEDMRKNEMRLQTFQHMPPRPPDIDPEKYFSPALLEVNENIFTLYHLTNTEAAYRSWGKRQVAEIAFDLRLAHVYWKGWEAALRFFGSRIVMFEPAIDQLFPTPEKALEALLTFCSEEDSMRRLLQRLMETKPPKQLAVTNEVIPQAIAKPPLRVNHRDFVWQKQTSEGDLYQAKRASFVHFKKVYFQLIETWSRGWLGAVQCEGIEGIDFEKEARVGFSTPEEALAAIRTFVAEKDSMQKLREIHLLRKLRQCEIGRYDQISSIRMTREGQ